MIVGFSGTRQGPTPAQHMSMDRFLIAMFVNHGAKVLVHGGAAGCDTFAHHAVTANAAYAPEVWIFPALEGQRSSVVILPVGNCIIGEPVPALMRNKIIAGLADGLLAVPASDTEQDRSGTWATVRAARKRGCPVYIVRRDGTIIRDAESLPYERSDTWPFVKRKKVEHVKRAGQTRNHQCHWPGCREQVPPAKWSCLNHWRRLPKRFRDQIWNAYRIGQETDMQPSREYVAVVREVRNWILSEGDPL